MADGCNGDGEDYEGAVVTRDGRPPVRCYNI